MPIIAVRIPQLGEGLQEARLVEFLKSPGDAVRRDEPIYVMETDKAVTEVESPYAGKLVEWVAETNSVLAIGAEIAKMEVAEGVKEIEIDHGHTPPPAAAAAAPTPSAAPRPAAKKRAGGVPIPPRTRKYLREKGLLDVADQIPAAGKKLMPADVDLYLSGGGTEAEVEAPVPANVGFQSTELPADQLTLNYRLKRGADACVPATIGVDVDWTAMQNARAEARGTTGETSFSMLLWCVTQAMKEFPRFRSTLSGDGKTLKTFDHVNLGVAVALPGDVLKTAVVRDADTLDRKNFREAVVQRIEEVRGGDDQIDATTTLTVSNIGKAGVRLGIPVVVKPAVATLALGEVQQRAYPVDGGVAFRPEASLVLTFDHLVINGVGAANFLHDVKQRIESFVLEQEAVQA